MRRDLRGTSMRRREMGEDVDPAVGLLNLADIMLVFACGLMMALITFWNIDLAPQLNEVTEQEVTEVSSLEEAEDILQSSGNAYSEVGKVYQDSVTGKYYMLKKDAEGTTDTEGE
jgi:hypothetical protein